MSSHEDFRQWHRLFGIALTDLFMNTPWRVELEKELALRSQLLDVVIIKRVDFNNQTPDLELPDGLEGLRKHNLLTYKSLREPLDAWTLEELIGHYVNYRKLLDVATEDEDFQLYAVATRFPYKLKDELTKRGTIFEPTENEGVFNLHWGTRIIRLIILSRVSENTRNVPWELFSMHMEHIKHGIENYQSRIPDARDLLYKLYLRYQLELPDMTYTREDFTRRWCMADPEVIG